VKCPRCGAQTTGLERRNSLETPGFIVCFGCGYRALARRRPTIDLLHEIRTFVGIQWIYTKHGLAAWLLASVVLLITSVHSTLALFQRTIILRYATLSVFCSVILGFSLGLTMFLTGWLFPRVKVIHILAPLSLAAAIGFTQGYWIALILPKAMAAVLRDQILRTLSGAGLAILVTPIIIVRSSKMGAKKGLRPPLNTTPHSGDVRWDF
jgi:DNA-directed RNA polymerase subunit RPC12/RpoP